VTSLSDTPACNTHTNTSCYKRLERYQEKINEIYDDRHSNSIVLMTTYYYRRQAYIITEGKLKSIYIHLQLFENNILKKTIQNFGWYIYNGTSISSVICNNKLAFCNNISLPSVIICGHQDNGIRVSISLLDITPYPFIFHR
jgi:hypothetical protein